MFTHLQWIDEQNKVSLMPETRYVWHYIWAQIFQLFHIDRTEIFLRAYVIHYVQSISSFFMLFYFSRVFIKNLFAPISAINLNYLAYWSTLIWFTVLSTASENHQQIWILWYSINYQISLPLTLLMTGLTISLIFESSSNQIKAMKLLLIVIVAYTVLRIHAMEFIYFLMYLFVLMLMYIDKIIFAWKKYIYIALPLTLMFIYGVFQLIDRIQTFSYRQVPIFEYLSIEKLPQLLDKVRFEGTIITQHYNKAYLTLNELVYLSLAVISLLLIIVIYRHYKKYTEDIHVRLLLFLFIASFFILIPVFQYSAGIAGLLTYRTISYRFYFSSLLFLVIPVFMFYIFRLFKLRKIWMLNLLIFFILLGTFLYSKYNTSHRPNYYINISSIKNAFNKEKVGFNLSDENIAMIGEKIKYYESMNHTNKSEFYYARDDIAFVIKFIYQKSVFYGRRGTINYIKSYHEHSNTKYYPVLFDVPKQFPAYHRHL